MQDRSRRAILYLFIAAGLVFRIVNVLIYSPADFVATDPGRHWYFATHPLASDSLTAIDPIGFQLWLGAIAKLTLGDRTAISVYAALLSCLATWCWYRFARELFGHKTTALCAWTIILFLPDMLTMFSYYMIETLLLLLIGLSFWQTWRALRKRSTSSVLWAGTLWTATCLTKVSALPLAVLAMSYLLWRDPYQRTRRTLACALIALAMCTPVAYRSYSVLHVWSPFGFTAMNQVFWESEAKEIHVEISKNHGTVHWAYMFGPATMQERPLAPISDWKTPRSEVVTIRIDSDLGWHDWNRALLEHRPTPERLLRLWKENLILLFFGKSWPASHWDRFWEKAGVWSRWIWFPMFAVLAYALVRLRKAPPDTILPLAICVVGWIAFVILPSVPMEGRQRLILEPLTICALGQGVILLRKTNPKAPAPHLM